MKIKIFIVTYRSPAVINANIRTLFSANFLDYDIECNIINNHSNFSLDEQFKNKCNVLHNQVRSDLSCGHLARNWNQALILGFENLNNPKCDIVITTQDDVVWENDWVSKLKTLLTTTNYDFFNFFGDAICIYKPEAVKKVGLWDERFCSIGFQEADYFFRQLVFNKNGCSINDRIHRRTWNTCFIPKDNNDYFLFDISSRSEVSKRTETFPNYLTFHNMNQDMFVKKWNIGPESWGQSHYNYNNNCLIPSYIHYPYFEIGYYKETIIQQNYNTIQPSSLIQIK